jgi:hypothetical protein
MRHVRPPAPNRIHSFQPIPGQGFGRCDSEAYFAIGSDNRYDVPALSKLNFQENAYGQTCP